MSVPKGRSSFSKSGIGILMTMLDDHSKAMHEQDSMVDAVIKESGTFQKTLMQAKLKSLETESELLKSIMDDIQGMTDFLNNIVYLQNQFDQLYEPYKKEQQIARKKYDKDIKKYELAPKPACKVDSFIQLLFEGQNIHKDTFQKFITNVDNECKSNKVKIISNSGAQLKQLPRAFYKVYYLYKGKHELLTDVLRCSLGFDNFEDIYKTFNIIETLATKYNSEILRVKDRFNPDSVPFGYRDLLINIYCPGTQIVCEIQLHHKIFYQYKEDSHDVYKYARLFEKGEHNQAFEYVEEFVRPKIGNKLTYDQVRKKNQNIESNNNESTSSSTNINKDKKNEQEQEEEDNDNDDEEKEDKKNWKDLLREWNLEMYIDILDKEGWDDQDDWIEFDEDSLVNMGFKKGHIKRFLKKINDLKKENQKKKKKEKDDEGDNEEEGTEISQKNLSNFVELLKKSKQYSKLILTHQIIEFETYIPGKCVQTEEIKKLPPQWTIMGWCKPSQNRFGIIVGKDQCSIGTNQFRFDYLETGHIALFVTENGPSTFPPHSAPNYIHGFEPGGYKSALTSQNPIPLNQWTHLALIHTCKECLLYINGNLDCIAPNQDPVNGIKHHNYVPLKLGSRDQGAHYGGEYDNWNQQNNNLHNPFYGELKNWVWMDTNLDDTVINLHRKNKV